MVASVQQVKPLASPNPNSVAVFLDMETRFNISLIQRSTRHFKVTPLGQEFFEECSKVIAQVECAENVLLRQKSEPQGLIKISCPSVMMHFQIRNLLNQFLKDYPKVQIELELTTVGSI